jgi:[ribosomal protein S18]-alanine N-acetyltransferase
MTTAPSPQDMAALHSQCFVMPRPWLAHEFADFLSSPFCFVLTSQDGFLLGRALAGEAELLTLAIHPRARRQGQGRDLVQRFLQRARLLAAQTAFLEVAADNAAAQSLYRNCGFDQVGLRPAYYKSVRGQAVDAIVMSCPLLSQAE